MSIKYAVGDLLECSAEVIVQQTNCVTVKPHGLSQAIAIKYPYANYYATRQSVTGQNRAIKYETPGTIKCLGPPDSQPGPVVVNLNAQISPGRHDGIWQSKYGINPKIDNAAQRLRFFKIALLRFSVSIKQNLWKNIAFPFQIGSGLAGGDWKQYKEALETWASSLESDVLITIMILPSDLKKLTQSERDEYLL